MEDMTYARLDSLKERLRQATGTLQVMIDTEERRPDGGRLSEINRLRGKREGASMALSYVEEDLKQRALELVSRDGPIYDVMDMEYDVAEFFAATQIETVEHTEAFVRKGIETVKKAIADMGAVPAGSMRGSQWAEYKGALTALEEVSNTLASVAAEKRDTVRRISSERALRRGGGTAPGAVS